MTKFLIEGGNKLQGDITIQGSKNAVLPLYAASILTEEEIVLSNVPHLADVENMGKILTQLGAKVVREGKTVTICAKNVDSYEIPNELAKNLRSSVFLLGSVLARMRKAKVAHPGGCDIGLRPIDLHIQGLRKLGVDIEDNGGYIVCDAQNLKGNDVWLDYPSVGATENIMLASVLAKGKTVIHNAAREPEIWELQNFLIQTGAKVCGAGTSKIYIEGVEKIHGTTYSVMPDRIVTGTYLLAFLVTGGEGVLHRASWTELHSLLEKIDKRSCIVEREGDSVYVKALSRCGAKRDVTTQPYPGFPTDLQAPFCTYAALSSGTCVLSETIFENRFRHVPELCKMGADICVRDRVAVIRGVPFLLGGEVTARDLRGGASLVLAGLSAQGISCIGDVYHIDRGYENMEEILSEVGAKIIRV